VRFDEKLAQSATAFTRCKLAPASQVSGMLVQTFRASRMLEVATRFKVQLSNFP
jgi:hypothetical protein